MCGWSGWFGVDRPLQSDGRSPGFGFPKPDPPGFVNNDLEASFVDHHLMVEPAEDYQLVLVGDPALAPRGLVVDLKPVPGLAAVGGTTKPVFRQ